MTDINVRSGQAALTVFLVGLSVGILLALYDLYIAPQIRRTGLAVAA